MSNNLVRVILAVVVIAHGIGHVLFLVPALGMADWGQSTRSWALTGAIGDATTRLIGSIIWYVATVVFTLAAVGMIGQTGWWRSLAVVASIISALGILLFWANPVSSSAFFALVFDAVVLAALLLFHWPPVSVVGPNPSPT